MPDCPPVQSLEVERGRRPSSLVKGIPSGPTGFEILAKLGLPPLSVLLVTSLPTNPALAGKPWEAGPETKLFFAM